MTTPGPLEPADARRHGLDQRRELDGTERSRRTAEVFDRLAALPELVGPGRLATYAAVRSEIDLGALVPRWRLAGWEVHLPRLVGAGGMEFVRFPADGELSTNRYGITEPAGPAVAVGDLDVVVVPCVAVDVHGTRVGHGAGYYDRALADSPRPSVVGVAFDVQRVAAIRRREWDVPLDVVVTDAGVFRP